jgi:hypothetical protein
MITIPYTEPKIYIYIYIYSIFTVLNKMFMKSIIQCQLTVIPRRKFTVNHEKRPSSDPSIIETEFSFVRNGDSLNSFLTYN